MVVLRDPSKVLVDYWTTEASYIIYRIGNVYYARNGRTGAIDYSGTDAKTVVQNALNALTSGRTWKERVALKGNFEIDNSVNPLTVPDYTFFELDGKLIALDKTKTLLSVGNNVTIEGGVYDGNRGTEYGGVPRVIHVEGKNNVLIEDVFVLNGYSRGIEVDYGNNVVLRNVVVDNSYRNVMVWVDPADLATHNGKVALKEVWVSNAVENGIDFTYPRLELDGIYAFNSGSVDIVGDGFRESILNNVHCSSLILVVGVWAGNIGINLTLNNVLATRIYQYFAKKVESLKANNVNLEGASGHGWEMRIDTTENVEYVELNNVEIKGFGWSGLLLTREAGVTGRFKNVFLNNVAVRDGAQRGFHLLYCDYLKLTNCVARGNDWRGFVINNCTYVKMVNCNSIKVGKHSQDGPLDLNTVDRFKAVGCFFEYGGVHTSLTNVTNYDFISCGGDFPLLRNSGVETFSGDGTTTTFNIPHGLILAPTKYVVSPLTPDADAARTITADDTNIIVTYVTAPPAGTDNLKFGWYAEV